MQHTVPEAFNILFEHPLSKYPKLRSQLNSLIRGDVIPVTSCKGAGAGKRGGAVERSYRTIAEKDYPVLYNSVLLLALFPDQAQVKKILENTEERHRCASIVKMVLYGRKNLLDEVTLSEDVSVFLSVLSSEEDLKKSKLPMPFVELPQVVFEGGNLSLLELYLAKGLLKNPQDMMLMAFLKRDLAKAYSIATTSTFSLPEALLLRDYIITTYRNAQDLKNYLEDII